MQVRRSSSSRTAGAVSRSTSPVTTMLTTPADESEVTLKWSGRVMEISIDLAAGAAEAPRVGGGPTPELLFCATG